jgi:hypothetical protein
MEKFKQQRNRRGEWISTRVDTKARVSTLQFIRENFMYWSEFIPFSLEEYLDKKLGYYYRNDLKEIAKEKQRLKRLVRAGWLKKPDKNGKFQVSNKFNEYLKKWGYFDNSYGPLMKPKEKEKIVEKEVKKETKESKKEDVVGFV